MAATRFLDYFFDVEFRAFASVERPPCLIEIGAELPQLLDMLQNLPGNILLGFFRQRRHFGHRMFQAVYHIFSMRPVADG